MNIEMCGAMFYQAQERRSQQTHGMKRPRLLRDYPGFIFNGCLTI